MSALRQVMRRAPTPRSYADVVLEDSPVGFWRMNEAAGVSTFEDDSGNNRDLTKVGTITSGGSAKTTRLGLSAKPNGSSGYWTVASSTAFQITGNATFECWFRTASKPSNGTAWSIMSCSTSGNGTSATNRLYQVQIQTIGGINGFGGFHQNGSNSSNTVPQVNFNWSLNTWYHYVVARDSVAKNYRHYINGALIGSAAYTNNPDGGGSTSFAVAALNVGSIIQFFNGDLDEVAVYNAALSLARIKEHYRAAGRG